MVTRIIGIFLILFAVYTPISFFVNLPPFATDKEAYIYESIPLLLNKLPESVEVKSISEERTRLVTYNEIQNPEYYGLELKRKSHAQANPWYYPPIGISVVCIIGGLALLATERKKRN